MNCVDSPSSRLSEPTTYGGWRHIQDFGDVVNGDFLALIHSIVFITNLNKNELKKAFLKVFYAIGCNKNATFATCAALLATI
jgi:hypothetical protein